MSKEEAKREIGKLVERLKSLSPSDFRRYNEENTKKDFILPMFRALGWNTDDFREVAAEDRVSRGHVDYAFRLDSRIPFFLEAKPLKADLDNPDYARQAIKYAWNRGVSWAVLTDFENLKVFNAEWEERDLRRNIFLDLSYQDYLKEFDLVWLLSKPAMQQRLLDQEAEKVGKKTKKRPVGEQLFEDLVKWRWELRRHLEPYNRKRTAAQIDEAVQRILDRLIFIRAAEDRGIEQERLLLSLVRQWQGEGRKGDFLKMLNSVFRDFDEGYDSALFERHFSEELDCEPKPFEDTITGLYRTPDGINEYDFNAIGADVLGGIYEQYLGYAQGLAVEEVSAKRERRKKQGIYYTPQFVVKYIVQNTVGRLLEERSHHEIRKLRILDPACGSGSFLIEAFDVLDQYRKGRRRTDELQDYSRRLEILTENIYGVDLDPQAVEIAQLNLLLKTLNRRERLPNLNPNIRRGNSLISGTRKELSQYFGADYTTKRPFNWEEEFPKVMKDGGFDVVIGNPPYVPDIGLPVSDNQYYRDKFESATGKYDLYMLFVEQGLRLCKQGGYFAYIIPNKFMQTKAGRGLRKSIRTHSELVEIVDFGDTGVFKDATNYPCILILRRTDKPQKAVFQYKKVNGYPEKIIDSTKIKQDTLSDDIWVFGPPEEMRLYERLLREHIPLDDWTEKIFTGIQSGADKLLVFNKRECRKQGFEMELLKPILRGRNIKKYSVQWEGRSIFYPYLKSNTTYTLIPEKGLKKRSKIFFHLSKFRSELRKRVWYDQTAEELSGAWYGLMYIGDPAWFFSRKIMTPALSAKSNFALDEAGYLFFTGTAGGYGLILKKELASRDTYLYLLGILNSKVTEFCIKKISPMFSGGFYKFNTQYLKRLPIRRIDFGNPQDVKFHNRMVELVGRMLELHKGLKDAVGEEEKDLERQIERTDRQIDALVYELYGITEEERKIIEGKG